MLFFAQPLAAQEFEPTEAQKQHIADQIEASKQRLQLSEEQTDAVETILHNSMVQSMAIMKKYNFTPGSTRPSMRTMRKMRKEMSQHGEETKKQLAAHLTESQMDTWESLEKERQDRMRERLRSQG